MCHPCDHVTFCALDTELRRYKSRSEKWRTKCVRMNPEQSRAYLVESSTQTEKPHRSDQGRQAEVAYWKELNEAMWRSLETVQR